MRLSEGAGRVTGGRGRVREGVGGCSGVREGTSGCNMVLEGTTCCMIVHRGAGVCGTVQMGTGGYRRVYCIKAVAWRRLFSAISVIRPRLFD